MESSTKITPDVNEEAIKPIKTDDGKELDLNKEPDQTNVEDNLNREQKKIVASALAQKRKKMKTDKKKKKKLVQDLEDDSEETRKFMRRWIPSKTPKWLINVTEEHCSRAIQKQLTESDVNGERLVLPKSQVVEKFLPFLEKYKPEITSGKEILVYGPDGKAHKTMRMWGYDDQETTTDDKLVTGWKKFVEDYDLKEICDFITVWMFMENDQICLAVGLTRFSLRNQVSKRISKEFEKSDEERGARMILE